MQSFLSEEQILGKGGLLEDYIKKYGMCNIQLDSYEACLKELDEIVQEEIYTFEANDIKTIIKFSNLIVENPTIIEDNRIKKKLMPHEARIRKENYWGNVKIDIEILKIKDSKIIDTIYHIRHPICKFPIMIGSSKCNLYNKSIEEKIALGECEYDKGGYFITSGHERVLISQLRMNYNSIICFPSKINKYSYIAEMRSMSNETGHSILIKAYISIDGKQLFFSLPGISLPINVSIVVIALGFTIEEFMILIDPKLIELKSILSKNNCITQSDALKFIGKHTMQIITDNKEEQCARQILENELFPHCGVYISKKQIGIILAKMILKLYLTYQGLHPIDNRDHLGNKRIDTPGMLLRDLFRPLFKRWARALGGKKIEIMAASTITQSLKHAIMTGSWSAPKTAWARQGVSQILTRWNIGATLSHKRRVMIPVGKEGKNTAIRQIHASEAFFICPCETPEGHAVGIVKNLSILTSITTRTKIRNFLEKLDFIKRIESIKVKNSAKYYKVWLNGIPIGFVKNINLAIKQLKKLRCRNIIPNSVSISKMTIGTIQEIIIYSDDGRCSRPLFSLEKSIKSTNWDILKKNKKIQYLDIYEIENQIVAMYSNECKKNSEFTFLEIFPSTMLGVMASMIPYPDHTQSPRNTYQAAMGKQAMSIFATNTNIRTDTIIHELIYPQESIVRTHVAEYLGFCNLPFGTNAICAVMCHTGYNQEDAKILNQTSIDLGFMRNYTYRTVTEEEGGSGNGYATIAMPPYSIYFKSRNYNKLDANGIIKIGSKVNQNDVLVGKIYKKGNSIIDISRVAKHKEEGIVDSVFITETLNGYKLVKIKIRILRIPETGDKFASCCAQKGTVGLTFGRENMPFTTQGITPDIIINAHAFPSRMTINELIEAIAAKTGAITGEFKYSTPFSSHSINIIDILCDNLENCGFERHGNEVMYNGFTGEKFDVKIFIAPIYKQRLKHLVVEKIHARDHGPMQLLFKQPLEGRSRNGGLRFGEMEHDCVVSYGATNLLLERLLKVSDPFTIPICRKCKLISNKRDVCTLCHGDDVKITSIPYASKLLFQLLNALCIKTAFTIKSSEKK